MSEPASLRLGKDGSRERQGIMRIKGLNWNGQSFMRTFTHQRSSPKQRLCLVSSFHHATLADPLPTWFWHKGEINGYPCRTVGRRKPHSIPRNMLEPVWILPMNQSRRGHSIFVIKLQVENQKAMGNRLWVEKRAQIFNLWPTQLLYLRLMISSGLPER